MRGPSVGEGVQHRVWGLAGSFSCRPCRGEVSEGQAGAGCRGMSCSLLGEAAFGGFGSWEQPRVAVPV